MIQGNFNTNTQGNTQTMRQGGRHMGANADYRGGHFPQAIGTPFQPAQQWGQQGQQWGRPQQGGQAQNTDSSTLQQLVNMLMQLLAQMGGNNPQAPNVGPSTPQAPNVPSTAATTLTLPSNQQAKLLASLHIYPIDTRVDVAIIDNDKSGKLSVGDTAIISENGRELARYTVTADNLNAVQNGVLGPNGGLAVPVPAPSTAAATLSLPSDQQIKLLASLSIYPIDTPVDVAIIDNDNSGKLSVGDTAIISENGRELARYTVTAENMSVVENSVLGPYGKLVPHVAPPAALLNPPQDQQTKLLESLNIHPTGIYVNVAIIDNDNSGKPSAGDTAIISESGREQVLINITAENAQAMQNSITYPNGGVAASLPL